MFLTTMKYRHCCILIAFDDMQFMEISKVSRNPGFLQNGNNDRPDPAGLILLDWSQAKPAARPGNPGGYGGNTQCFIDESRSKTEHLGF